MKYGLGLAFRRMGLGNALDKAWNKIRRIVLPFQHTSGSLTIFPVIKLTDVTFGARRLDAKHMARVYSAEPGSLTAIILSYLNI